MSPHKLNKKSLFVAFLAVLFGSCKRKRALRRRRFGSSSKSQKASKDTGTLPSIDVSDDFDDMSDFDDFPDVDENKGEDFSVYHTNYQSCTVNIDDVSTLVGKEFNVYVEKLDDFFNFKVTEFTTLLDISAPGEYDCIFEYEKNFRTKLVNGRILCIAEKSVYQYFETEPDLKKRVANIMAFDSCNQEQKRFILQNATLSQESEENSINTKTPITDNRALEMMFNLCKNSLSPDIRNMCQSLVKELHKSGRRADEAGMILSDILNTSFPPSPEDEPELPDYDECIAILKKYHLGDDALIEHIARQIRLQTRRSFKYTVFVLLGPPGVGKTSLGKAIAECLRLPYEEIPCRNRNPVDLGGISRMYDGARHGEIIERVRKHRGKLLMLLDEFDKMTVDSKEGDTSSMFDSVFDDRKCFNDRFSNFPCPVNNIVFVISCNDMKGVSAPIIDRFSGNIFTIPGYDNEKKAQISEEFIVPRFMKEFNFTEEEVVFSKDGLLATAETTTDDGARLMSQQIEKLFGFVNNRIEKFSESTPIVVDRAFVEGCLDKVYTDEQKSEIKSIKGFCA